MSNNYICALDVGSSKLATVVAEVKRGSVPNIFCETLPAKGFKKGVIVDSISLIDSIGRALKNLKSKSNINIKSICINVSGQDIVTKHSRAVIPLAERGNKVIALSDIQKVNEQARILGSSLEEEIIHQIPASYTIDSGSGISNPIGLYSHRLETDLYLVFAKLSSVQSMSRCVNQAGYEVKKIFFSGLATSKAVFDKEQKTGTNILCDIGSDITELLIFQDAILNDTEVLSLGGDDLTEELAEELKIPFDLAEDIKRSHGAITDYSENNEDKEILVKKNNFYRPIKQKLVSQILTAKTKSICHTLKDALEKKVALGNVNNFMVTGRTVLLEGFLEMLENNLGISVKIGRIRNQEISSLLNKENMLAGQNYLTYTTALGMVCQALDEQQPKNLPTGKPSGNPLASLISRVKEVYQEYF